MNLLRKFKFIFELCSTAGLEKKLKKFLKRVGNL
jgi:hypothetical protein